MNINIYEVRIAAVQKIDDESILADIVKNDSKRYVCKTALERINDENILADIAKNDSDYAIRKIAVGKIYDESVLKYIAENDSDSDVREAAAENLKMKPCPNCNEKIPKNAIRCKHCKTTLKTYSD